MKKVLIFIPALILIAVTSAFSQREKAPVDVRFPVVHTRDFEGMGRLDLRKDLLNSNVCIAERYDRDGVLVNSFAIHPGSCI